MCHGFSHNLRTIKLNSQMKNTWTHYWLPGKIIQKLYVLNKIDLYKEKIHGVFSITFQIFIFVDALIKEKGPFRLSKRKLYLNFEN